MPIYNDLKSNSHQIPLISPPFNFKSRVESDSGFVRAKYTLCRKSLDKDNIFLISRWDEHSYGLMSLIEYFDQER